MLEAVKKGATFVPATVKAGELYWKLIRADGPEWWDGKHGIYVDVWDERGLRMVGVPVMFAWPGDQQVKPTEPKQGEPFAVDFPMFNARPAFNVWVDEPNRSSDQLHGLGLIPFEAHVSYRLIFQLTRAEGVVTPPPPAPPPSGKRDKVVLTINDVVVYQS